jgi:hypothetical protein
MPDDERLTWDLLFQVPDVLERHGYHRGDNQHTGHVIGLLGDAARIYERTLDAASTPYVVGAVVSADCTATARPGCRNRLGWRGQDLLATLDDAAGYKRTGPRRAPTAPTCPAPSGSCACGPRGLRPDGRVDEPICRGLRCPEARPRPGSTRQQRPAGGRRPGGRTVTRHRTAQAQCTTGQTRRVTP